MVTENEETTTETKEEVKQAFENEEKLEDEFAEFLNTSSEHSFENNETEKTQASEAAPENNLSFADEFKVTMFIGFIFMFLDGIHAFAYQFVSKYKFDKKELAMDKEDKEALEMYFKTPRVAAILNKIPTEIIGVAHMEYIYFTKFQEMIEMKKEEGTLELKKKKLDRVEEDEEEETTFSKKLTEQEILLAKLREKYTDKEIFSMISIYEKPVKKVAKKKAVKKTAKKKATA
jgi:hypothetical protein